MSKKILITRAIPEIGLKILRDKGYEVEVGQKAGLLTKEELIAAVGAKPYDAVLTLLTDKVDAEVLAAVPTAKIFANYAVGFDNFDLAAAKAAGVTVTNTPGQLASSVAEFAFALMLALTKKIIDADQFVRDDKYVGWDPMIFIGSNLARQTIGIIGLGRIGSRLAYHAAQGFDMKVIYHDVVRQEVLEKKYGIEYRAGVEEVCREADFLSLNVPLLDSTRHLINSERLKLMKSSAFLINTARGPVVDEAALVEALKNKVIAGAALDVYENEPGLAAGLKDLPNVILTPHIASATESARNEMATLAANNIVSFLETGKAINPVA